MEFKFICIQSENKRMNSFSQIPNCLFVRLFSGRVMTTKGVHSDLAVRQIQTLPIQKDKCRR